MHLLLFMALLVTPLQQTQSPKVTTPKADEWREVSPTGAGAMVQMPKRPRYVSRSFTPVKDQPPVNIRMQISTLDGNKGTLVFAYHDIHQPMSTTRLKKQTLDGAVNGSIARVVGSMDPKDHKTITFKTHKGREFVYRCLQYDKTLKIASRVYLVDQRLYQITAVFQESAFDQKLVDRYFNSFDFVKTKKKEETAKPKEESEIEANKDASGKDAEDDAKSNLKYPAGEKKETRTSDKQSEPAEEKSDPDQDKNDQ